MAEGSSNDFTATNSEEPRLTSKSKKRRRGLTKKEKILAIEKKYHAPTKELSLAGRGMTSLDHFPKLIELDELDLSDNAFTDGLEILIDSTPKVTILDLTGNKFADIDSLKPLVKLEHLENLSVFCCPLTADENYRSQIYDLLPNLKILDGFDRNDKQLQDNNSNENKIGGKEPSNSNGEKDPQTSSENEEERAVYKQFLQDQIKSEDESNDDEFIPNKDKSFKSENASETTSDAEYDCDNDVSKNTSSEVSDSEHSSQNESSSDDSDTNEPSAKRKHLDENSNENSH